MRFFFSATSVIYLVLMVFAVSATQASSTPEFGLSVGASASPPPAFPGFALNWSFSLGRLSAGIGVWPSLAVSPYFVTGGEIKLMKNSWSVSPYFSTGLSVLSCPSNTMIFTTMGLGLDWLSESGFNVGAGLSAGGPTRWIPPLFFPQLYRFAGYVGWYFQ